MQVEIQQTTKHQIHNENWRYMKLNDEAIHGYYGDSFPDSLLRASQIN